MISNFLLAVGSGWVALALWPEAGLSRGFGGGFVAPCLWQLYCAASHSRGLVSPVVLRLGRFSWRRED